MSTFRPDLDKDQEGTSSLLVRFLSGTISTGIGRVSRMVFGLASIMIITRHLPAEEFGVLIVIEVTAAFLDQISSLGLNFSLPRFLTHSKDTQRSALVNTSLYFRILTILLISLLALPFRTQLGALFDSALLPTLFIYVPLIYFLMSINRLLQAALQGFFRFRAIGISDVLSSVGNLVGVVVFVLWLQYGAIGLIYARAISLFISLTFIYVNLPISKRIEFQRDTLREMLVFGFPLQINDILTFVFKRIDTILVGVLLGPAGVGLYEVARKIPDSLTQAYEAFRNVFYPIVSDLYTNDQHGKAAEVTNNSTRLISFVTIAGSLIALFFGEEIITVLFSARYGASAPAFVLLMLALNLHLINYTLGLSVVAVGDTDKPAIINVAHSVVNLVGNIVFIPMMGIAGAAFSSLLGNAVTNPLYSFFLGVRSVDVRLWDYLKPIVLFGLFGGMYLLLQPIPVSIRLLLFALFLLSSVLFSIIPPDDLALVRDLVRERRILTILKP